VKFFTLIRGLKLSPHNMMAQVASMRQLYLPGREGTHLMLVTPNPDSLAVLKTKGNRVRLAHFEIEINACMLRSSIPMLDSGCRGFSP
jgi:hypothetical protein